MGYVLEVNIFPLNARLNAAVRTERDAPEPAHTLCPGL